MPNRRSRELTPAQVEIIDQFADYAFDYFDKCFDEVVRKVLPKGFGRGPAAKRFRREAKEAFDREREP
ncbi:MAG TPA: hypothetical protein VEJ46_10785 [Candidatus Acidoferrum sp.]|nr:hypothetical protein [Candidatus Acidoferrum sp.]